MRLVAGISVEAIITCLVCAVGWALTEVPASGGGSTLEVRKKTTAAAAAAARRPVSTSKIAVRFCFNYELLGDNINWWL